MPCRISAASTHALAERCIYLSRPVPKGWVKIGLPGKPQSCKICLDRERRRSFDRLRSVLLTIPRRAWYYSSAKNQPSAGQLF
jgi:hypothetical protein